MTKTSYALIFWEKENAYSVIHRRKILSGLEGDCLVGKTVMVRWDKEDLPAMFISFGSKTDMKALEDDKVKDVNNASLIQGAEDSKLPSASTIENPETTPENATDMSNITEGENGFALSVLCNDRSVALAQNSEDQKDEKIRSLEMQLAALEKRNSVLKKSFSSTPVEGDTKKKDIGGGFLVPVSFLTYIKLGFRDDPAKYFRKLLFDSGLFELETIAEPPLTGKPCALTKTSRPALDQRKLKVIKDYTIKTCHLQPRTFEIAEFERKIKNICSDARKILKKKSQQF